MAIPIDQTANTISGQKDNQIEISEITISGVNGYKHENLSNH